MNSRIASPGTVNKNAPAQLKHANRQLPSKPLPEGYEFCELGPDDKAEIFQTTSDRGWEADLSKWGYLLNHGQCLGLRHKGELVGTAGVNKFEDKTATLAMILVKKDHGGKGLGTALTRECISRCGEAVPTLYASEDGRPIYEHKFGFQEVGGSKIHLGRPQAEIEASTSQVRKADPNDWDAIVKLDAEANGANRETLLQHLKKDSATAVVSYEGDELRGFAMEFDGHDSAVIGPIVAKEPGLAKGLVSKLLQNREDKDEPVKIQLNESFSDLSQWLEENGMPSVARLPLMTLDGQELPGKPEWEAAVPGYPWG